MQISTVTWSDRDRMAIMLRYILCYMVCGEGPQDPHRIDKSCFNSLMCTASIKQDPVGVMQWNVGQSELGGGSF